MKPGQLWRIVFLDHSEEAGDGAWHLIGDLSVKAVRITAVGHVVATSPETVTLAVCMGGGECSTPFVIVRSAIIETRKLVLAKPIPAKSAATKPSATKPRATQSRRSTL